MIRRYHAVGTGTSHTCHAWRRRVCLGEGGGEGGDVERGVEMWRVCVKGGEGESGEECVMRRGMCEKRR